MRLVERLGYFTCDYCASTYFPTENQDGVRVLGGKSSANCPLCRIPLVTAMVAGTRVLACERCRGLLIHQGGFLTTIRALRAWSSAPSLQPRPIDTEDLQRAIDCPYCQRRMDTHPYAGPGNIVIDNCPECGVNWLDYNELTRIIRAPGIDRRRWE